MGRLARWVKKSSAATVATEFRSSVSLRMMSSTILGSTGHQGSARVGILFTPRTPSARTSSTEVPERGRSTFTRPHVFFGLPETSFGLSNFQPWPRIRSGRRAPLLIVERVPVRRAEDYNMSGLAETIPRSSLCTFGHVLPSQVPLSAGAIWQSYSDKQERLRVP